MGMTHDSNMILILTENKLASTITIRYIPNAAGLLTNKW